MRVIKKIFILHQLAWTILFVFMLSPNGFAEGEEVKPEELSLFTAKEAEDYRLSEEEWQLRSHLYADSIKAGKSDSDFHRGPRIVVKRPVLKNISTDSIIKASSPTDLFIFFEQNEAPVNMDSLQVLVKKGLLSMSVTYKFKPFIHGTSIQAKKIKIPMGKYMLHVTIADKNRVKTEKTYLLNVVGAKS